MKLVYVIILCFIMGSCHTASVLQTAKPVEKGKTEVSLAGTAFFGSDVMPGFDLMVRRGLGPRSDFGFAYCGSLYGHFRFDFKYVIAKTASDNLFLSSGVGLDLYLLDDWGSDIGMYSGLTLPVYFSFNHNNKVVPYFAQTFTMGLNDFKVMRHYNKSEIPEGESWEHNMFYTGGAGLRFQTEKRVDFVFEFSYKYVFTNRFYNYSNSSTVKYYDEDFLPQLSFGIVIKPKK
ncbi:MAG: hypothetical protein HUJ25_14955 [Crocinitomicaceae bacterium]|nr:hypothetical protein [Crocinitomicaceae bacterium]